MRCSNFSLHLREERIHHGPTVLDTTIESHASINKLILNSFLCTIIADALLPKTYYDILTFIAKVSALG
jgi:hypothetical protein